MKRLNSITVVVLDLKFCVQTDFLPIPLTLLLLEKQMIISPHNI